MLKMFKKPLAVLLAIIITITVTIPAVSTLVALADEEVVTKLLDFEEGESYTYGPVAVNSNAVANGTVGNETTTKESLDWISGKFFVTNDMASSGLRSFRRDWGDRDPYQNQFTFYKSTYFDLSNADVIVIDFYIDKIENWRVMYEDKAVIQFLDSNKKFVSLKLPTGLKTGWNNIEIKPSALSALTLSNVVGIRFRATDLPWWGNEGAKTPIPDGYTSDIANVSLRVDNIRKIKNPLDKEVPTCDTDKIEMATIGGTFVTAKLQFSDNQTAKDKISYILYASEEPIDESNVEACTLKSAETVGSIAKIENLKVNTAYYFAIKATDEAGNFAYLFDPNAVTTKNSDSDIRITILDFEDGEDYKNGPNWVNGDMGASTNRKTSGAKSFRRDLGGTDQTSHWANIVHFYRESGVFDLSDADILTLDLYVSESQLTAWNTYYASTAHILFAEEGSTDKTNGALASSSSYYAVKIPELQAGWNTIKINLNNFSIPLNKIEGIRISPLSGQWASTGASPGDSSANEVSLYIDNIVKIKNPIDTDAPTCDASTIKTTAVGGTFVTAKLGQFTDDYTEKDKIKYVLYASETPIDETNVEDCTLKTEETNRNTVKIKGLKVNTAYYFAIKAIDEAGNFAYLFDPNSVTTKSSDKNISTEILNFETGETFKYGPIGISGTTGTEATTGTTLPYINGRFHITDDIVNSGSKSFRRDWGYNDLYQNMFTFCPSEGGLFDLSEADVLAMDFYIDNIENWRKAYEGKAHILLRDNATKVLALKLPYELKQGWNTIEINLNELALELDSITAIRFTPNTSSWTNDGGKPQYPEGEETTVCNVSLRVDNIRTIIEPVDGAAPNYDHKAFSPTAVGGTHITVEFPPFTDNLTIKESLNYTLYASKTPINSSNVLNCKNNVTVKGISKATIRNLSADTEYYFAVKCTDEAGNSKYLFSDSTIRTNENADYVYAPIFSCEASDLEAKGPDWVPKGRNYNTEIKTEGNASLSGIITNQAHYQNLLIAYRKTNPVDISECNVLSLDFYIDDIEVFNKYWKDHLYIMISDVKNPTTTTSMISFAIDGELVEGWNSLQFPLAGNIDLSQIWTMRVSSHKEWQNDSGYNPGTSEAEVLIAIDNIRGEHITLEMDKRKPTVKGSYITASHLSSSSISVLHSTGTDNLTSNDNLTYEIIASETKLTKDNISTVKAQSAMTTGNSGGVTGLKANTAYYVAVRAVDEAGNKSDWIIGEESYKTLTDPKDHWYLITNCDKESGVRYYPDAWVGRVPSFMTENVAQGTSAITKTLANGSYVWHNLFQVLDINSDITYATRVDFKLYIDSLERFQTYWSGRLYFVIGDAWGQYAAYSIPRDIKEGWNDISVSLYGKDIDLANIYQLRITPSGSLSNDGSTNIPGVEEGEDVNLTVALDYVTAVYDASLLPAVAPTDDEATYITNCDTVEEGGYWSNGVRLDEFDKTEGAASIVKTFGYGPKRENAITYVALEPINMWGAEALHFDIYVPNIAMLKNRTEIEVKIGSSESADEQFWAFKLPLDDLQTGWNSVSMDLTAAFAQGADFDISNLRLFSLYCTKSIFLKGESLDIKLDNIRMTGDIGGATEEPEDTNGDGEYEIQYQEEFVTETVYEAQTVHKVDYQKSDPINKVSVKTYTHNQNYPLYVWILAIGVPIVYIGILAAFFIVGGIIKKRRKQL